MAFHMQDEVIVRIAILPEVREAAGEGARLMSLWPLSDAKLLDNDAKYTENLQVRITRAMAAIMTGEEVTIPDSEFVYEGAEEIPGRPQRIVDALLAANDACETMADYSQTGDTALVMGGCGSLGVDWGEGTITAVAQALEEVENAVADGEALQSESNEEPVDEPADSPEHSSGSVDIEAVAQRLATVLAAVDGLLGVIGQGDDPSLQGDDAESARLRAGRALPVMLYANELCERVSIPRVFISAQEFLDMIDARDGTGAAGSNGNAGLAVARMLAPSIAAEWAKHREDVLWDPQEAKKKAKEEDERKNKEALAAKFANAPDNKN
jgi:hypothetical protein